MMGGDNTIDPQAEDSTAKPTLVVSAPNLVEGGPLRILRDCAETLAGMTDRVTPVVVLNDASLIPDYPGVSKIVEPRAKRSWLRRMLYEQFGAARIARGVGADIWLSLHDITSNVVVPRKIVYCHNPSPFYDLSLREALLEPKFAMFNFFYEKLYSLRIRSNDTVIVQQDWLNREFERRFGPPRVVTAWPLVKPPEAAPAASTGPARVFFYPAFPRVFKNFEVICDAVRLLSRDPAWSGEVRITLDGSENRYAREIARRAADLPAIKLIGLQDKTAMAAQYDQADVVLFPSKLETWGLPISEARELGKRILLADLPFAHEALGTYDGATFLDPGRPDLWAQAMRAAVAGELMADSPDMHPVQPDFRTWTELMESIIALPTDASHSRRRAN